MIKLKFLIFPISILSFIFSASAQDQLALEISNLSKDKSSAKRLNASPEFNGGWEELSNYLNENLEYPPLAKIQGVEGKIIVEFSITESGKIKDIELQNSLMEELDREAIRLVRLMPRWQPAIQNGIPREVKYRLPIVFKLK